MIAGIARLTTTLRPRERQLQELIVNFNTTTAAFAAQSSSLTQAVGLLGPTLTTADAAFKSLDASLPATRGFARDFTPAVLETPATVKLAFPWIAQTRALLRPDELGGLLDALQPATEDLAQLQGASLQLLPQLDKANRCFSNTIIPAGNIGVRDGNLATRRSDGSVVENYKEFWYAMVGLAGEGSELRRQRQHHSQRARGRISDGQLRQVENIRQRRDRERDLQAPRHEPALPRFHASVQARCTLRQPSAAGRQRSAGRARR